MLKFLADTCFNGAILRGVQRVNALVDIVRAQDVGLEETPDPQLLEWAATEGRVVLSHDANTMIGFARERLRRGKSMPGLIIVPQSFALGRAIENIVLVLECCREEELSGQVLHLPM